MAQALLQLKNVSKYYVNGSNVVAGLSRANLTMYRGEFVAITGESGSGKSTLGHILSGILPYEDGEMYFNGAPTSHFDSVDWENYRKDHISFISQSYGILPGATVLDHIISALRLCGEPHGDAKAQAMKILEQVELTEVAHRRAAKLSSGQKQRLSIARALAKPCDILIADEPTGNLDAENSNQVIRLLAQAAQDRLVIIITHEYSEVADFVTRHIRLQDSMVSGDSVLRDRAVCPEKPRQKRRKQRLAPYVARIQLRSRPAWCGAVLLFFALTAFAVFAFLGSFIVALDDTTTRIFEPTAFRNGDKQRLAVVRADGEEMTQADYDTILDMKYVTNLERYSYAADINYSYQEGVDYERNYFTRNIGGPTDPLYVIQQMIQVYETDQFIQTVPLMSDGKDFLTGGRLPENFYEVVIAGDKDRIGESFDVYIRDFSNWAMGSYLVFHMTVVGTTDQGSGLYFHEDVSRMLTMQYFNGLCLFPVYDQIYSEVSYADICDINEIIFQTDVYPTEDAVLRDIGDTEMLISHSQYLTLREMIPGTYTHLYYQGGSEAYINHNIVGLHESTFYRAYGISPATFDAYMESPDSIAYSNPQANKQEVRNDQVSIYIKDYSYTQRVINALAEEGYLAISPFRQGAAKIDEDLAAKRVQTLIISSGALAAVLLLQLIVLRAMFGMENESYRIFSNVGLPYKTARNSVLLQVLSFTVAGQLMGLGALSICSRLQVQRILDLTKYLTTFHWLVLSAVHLLASGAVAAFVVRSLRKRIYPVSDYRTDLDIDEEEEAAV